ncbi:MAG: hypothetical protein AB4080_16555 [Trichodesmium sp.]
MENIEIHEFSTGIIPEILADGKWISRGFKVGEYMNLTLPQVPHCVARAIANKGFEVGKNRNSQKPTFVGRIVLSINNEEPDYSVVAVVTTGQDEYGRSTSFYRYFLCAGKDNIWQILDWINTQQKQGINLIFNPSETKEFGKPNQHKITTKPEITFPRELETWLNNQTLPVIIPPEFSELQIINKMAEVKANSQPTSWAFNVEAIEQPEQFILIHPANTEVATSLTKIQTNIVAKKHINSSTNVDRASLETAIKGLISGSQIKSEWLDNLIVKLQDVQVTSEYLNNLFDNLGASNAIKQGNANAQMIRLLTLRAIFIPETLPEYLNWLKINGEKNKEDEKQKISLQLQSQLRNYQKFLEPLITAGINHSLCQMLGGKISISRCYWLLKTKDSLWSIYFSNIKQQIRHDLEYLGKSLSHKSIKQETEQLFYGNTLWKKLIPWLKSRRYPCNYYQPFADLFAQLPDYELAAYFHQVSNGKVPKKIFKAAVSKSKSTYETTIFGLTVQQKLTFSDQINLLLKKYGVSVALTCLVLLSNGLFFALGYQAGKFNRGNISQPRNPEPSPSPKDIITNLDQNTVITIPVEKMEKALDKFPTTSSVIREIVRELETELLSQKYTIFTAEEARLEIIQAIKKILENDVKLQYDGAIEDELLGETSEYLMAQKEWIMAIYSYQEKFFSNGFGYIEPDKQTSDRLKCDIADLLEINLQPRPRRCAAKL